ncbi:peptidoglycan glycosyltransferase FtsI [Buchnera aphidicola (Hyadaphis tataricae)]|uniref:Peptidoglycan D,D-transpeptidase FtsI n=1 Tax=Buchnera aphidicola (Hyadaphis tataricae) TaxID=1241859 RepID=A0A4D6Y672_9GAMM|nr:peptidoglycan glycosyltransferase FtsI [Buchnera aphidicola]QCI21531.1 peptidoglycan glycosyltransferase FtsI [Buchnera aphidicola (Hyadaphis tataricae)]
MHKTKNIKFLKEKRFKNVIYKNYRFFILCSFISLSLLILISRLFFLQIINKEKLINEGNRRTLRIKTTLSTRGLIYDRAGYPLAVTVLVNAICADPRMIHDIENIQNDSKWKDLSKALSIPLKTIRLHINKHKNSKFVYLARQVNPDIGKYITKLKLPGIFILEESQRLYTTGPITSQLIGITNIDGEGLEGIEKSFNKLLQGKPGKIKIRKDNRGQIIEKTLIINKAISKNLTLSIDTQLQKMTYNHLNKAVQENQADSGTAVLIDIKTGEILAMVNSPAYDPNNMRNSSTNNIRNRAITDVFEPGSTVKPIVIMEGLKLGIIKENSIINTKPYLIKKHKIHDVSYHKTLTVTGILQKSSNVGVSRVALCIPTSQLIESYLKFGLGQPTQLGLIGEKNGFIPKRKHWSDLDKATFSFGYGLMVTPLQLARLYATIGSYGVYRSLSIFKVQRPEKEIRIFSKKYVKQVIKMLEKVAIKGGGGLKAAVKGYRVAVKTGTVKKIGKNGKYVKKYIAYTAGIAPASSPRFSLIVMIDNPKKQQYYGGAISAPVFSSIMESTLTTQHIQKDHELE